MKALPKTAKPVRDPSRMGTSTAESRPGNKERSNQAVNSVKSGREKKEKVQLPFVFIACQTGMANFFSTKQSEWVVPFQTLYLLCHKIPAVNILCINN